MFDYSEPDKSLYIQKRFPISDKEYKKLEEKYGKLCWYAASQLMLSNKKSYEDLQDYHSEISIGMFRAASYYKRQTFIENVFNFFSNSDILQNDDLIKLQELKIIQDPEALRDLEIKYLGRKGALTLLLHQLNFQLFHIYHNLANMKTQYYLIQLT